MTGFGINVLGFGGVGSTNPPFTSQVFTSSGTYTPTSGARSALFMAFGSRGAGPGGATSYAGGGGGYGEKYVSSLDASYSISASAGGTCSGGGASASSTPNYSRSGSSGSGDFSASGGTGGTGNPYYVDAPGGRGCGGGRCGNGGSGGNRPSGPGSGTTGAVPNGGNETSGVYDVSPYGITFSYTRSASQVPVYSSDGTDHGNALASHCNTAAGGTTNAGQPGWTSTAARVGAVLILEFY